MASGVGAARVEPVRATRVVSFMLKCVMDLWLGIVLRVMLEVFGTVVELECWE